MFFVIPQELRKPVCLHSHTSTTHSKTCCINTHLHARPKALTFHNMYTHRLESEETTSMLLTTHSHTCKAYANKMFFGGVFLGGGVWGVWVGSIYLGTDNIPSILMTSRPLAFPASGKTCLNCVNLSIAVNLLQPYLAADKLTVSSHVRNKALTPHWPRTSVLVSC